MNKTIAATALIVCSAVANAVVPAAPVSGSTKEVTTNTTAEVQAPSSEKPVNSTSGVAVHNTPEGETVSVGANGAAVHSTPEGQANTNQTAHQETEKNSASSSHATNDATQHDAHAPHHEEAGLWQKFKKILGL